MRPYGGGGGFFQAGGEFEPVGGCLRANGIVGQSKGGGTEGCGDAGFAVGAKRVRLRIEVIMQIAQQLAIFLENRPGMLAEVCEAIAAAGINIHAISTSDTVDHTVIRMVVSDARRALHLFEERGTLVVEDDVLMVEGDNRPGALAELARRLAKAKVNIEYVYCAAGPKTRNGLLIMRVSDPRKALRVLNHQP